MKEKYIRPQVVNFDVAENSTGLLPAIFATAAGYAAGRALTNAIKASPSRKLENLPKRKGEIL